MENTDNSMELSLGKRAYSTPPAGLDTEISKDPGKNR